MRCSSNVFRLWKNPVQLLYHNFCTVQDPRISCALVTPRSHDIPFDTVSLECNESQALQQSTSILNIEPKLIEPKMREREKMYSLAAFVNENDTLKRMVDLGLDLSEIEKMPDAGQLMLNQDWHRDVQPMAAFLIYAGVSVTKLGSYLTKNPYIFHNSINQLQERIDYLKSKKFSSAAISKIIVANKFWLNFDVKYIDDRLGWVQTEFQLSGDELRYIITKFPILISFGTGRLQMMNIVMQEHLGFTPEEMRKMFIHDPKLWLAVRPAVERTFDYVHNVMGFSHRRISLYPEVLRHSLGTMRNRHEFLKSLGRDQYDPNKPHYVPFQQILYGNDSEFCELLDQNVLAFNEFVKLND